MVEAIQHSCNVYFYQVMLKVGLDNWSNMGAQFGFGHLTGIDIYEENPGLLPIDGMDEQAVRAQGGGRGASCPAWASGRGSWG